MPSKKSTKKSTKKSYNKKSYNKSSKYRNAVANQIQLAVPRPLSTQLVRMIYRNSVYWKPALIANVQPTLGFNVNVNQPHGILGASTFVGSPQEVWTSTLASGGQVQHFASWVQKYNKYLVRGSKVSVTFRTEANSSTSDRSGKLCLIRHGPDSTINQNTTWNGIINTNQTTRVANISPSTTTMNQARLSLGFSATKAYAIKESAITANPEIQGDIQGGTYFGPSEEEYITCCYVSPFPANTTGAFNMPEGLLEFQIEYLVQFIDPKQNTSPQPDRV